MDIIERISSMLEGNGTGLYGGEAVTQTQHALQCAALAEADGAAAPLVTAALLHDVGHVLDPEFETSLAESQDLVHEDVGERFLNDWFGDEVTQPVKLHVAAKRYLCAVDSGYFDRLSAASVLSLKLQGGPMSDTEVTEFEANPHHRDAVRLRMWDDKAKDPDRQTPGVAHFMAYAARCLKTGANA
ncbi:MAG: phosphonate degradation HD-domain oxygenase [Pseudomonadota bacterium]